MTGIIDSLKSAFHHSNQGKKQEKQQQQQSPPPNQQPKQQANHNMQSHHHAPSSAQHAQFAAYLPPQSDSMQRDFAGPNPAHDHNEYLEASAGGSQQLPAKYSPGINAATAQHNFSGVDHREAAAQMVEQERARKSQQPYFEGLPSNLELLEKMGDGAFSSVHKAYDRNTKQKVAVKCVRKFELNSQQTDAGNKHLGPEMKKKPRATERANILKEVQIMRGLKHPGVIQLLGFTESKEHYFIVLELCEGGELFHQIVKLTYFSEELARHVILQVAHAIRYLHEERGVVHRDIKPENLLFNAIPYIPSKVNKARPYDEEKEDEGEFTPGVGGGGIGVVKLADFGLSKVVWDQDTMTPCGTVGYTAPEIVKDERYSKAVDMWALGCVLYTLLCGFPPFYDESINVLTEKVAKGYYTFLQPWWDDISATSKDLITHLLCVDPEERYTIDEFLAHPWCNEKPPVPAEPAVANAAKASLKVSASDKGMPVDSPLMQEVGGGPRGARSPGVNTLREAFDVSYAVHRMEEEGARKRQQEAAGGARSFLPGLNEDDEEDTETVIENTKRKYGDSVASAMREQVARDQAAGGKKTQQIAPSQYQGWGGADRKMAEAALYDGRAGARDRGRQQRNKNFELSLNNATLLGRRGGGAGPGGAKPSPLSQQVAQ